MRNVELSSRLNMRSAKRVMPLLLTKERMRSMLTMSTPTPSIAIYMGDHEDDFFELSLKYSNKSNLSQTYVITSKKTMFSTFKLRLGSLSLSDEMLFTHQVLNALPNADAC